MGTNVLTIRDFDSTPDAVGRLGLPGLGRPRLRIPHLDLVAGECHAVIGKSGAGKTVLNSLLLGMPSSRIGRGVRVGEMAWWNGGVSLRASDFRNSSGLLSRWRQIRRSGTLLYLPQILPDGRGYQMSTRTYLEQVLAALGRQAGDALPDASSTFKSFPKELSGVLENPVTSLSGGERRRIELWARLSVLKALPKDRLGLLILDEPTTGLDVPDERRYLEDLRRMMAGLPNLAVLVTTHALYFLDDNLPSGESDREAKRQPLFDKVCLVHKEPLAETVSTREAGPACRVTSAVDSQWLCDAVKRRTPEKSVEDSMEAFIDWQTHLFGTDFTEQVEKAYFMETAR